MKINLQLYQMQFLCEALNETFFNICELLISRAMDADLFCQTPRQLEEGWCTTTNTNNSKMHQSIYSTKKNIYIYDSSHKEYNVLLINATAAAPWFLCCMYSLCWTSTSALCRPVSFKTRSNLGRRALAFTLFWLEPERWDWEKHTQQHIWSQTATRALSRHSERALRDTSLASDQSSSQDACRGHARVIPANGRRKTMFPSLPQGRVNRGKVCSKVNNK